MTNIFVDFTLTELLQCRAMGDKSEELEWEIQRRAKHETALRNAPGHSVSSTQEAAQGHYGLSKLQNQKAFYPRKKRKNFIY